MMGFSPVLVVTGGDGYRRRKRVRRLLQGLRGQGWRISEVEGEDRPRIAKLMTGSSLFKAKTLILVENPAKIDRELVLRQYEKPTKNIVLFLHLDGEAVGGFKKLVKELPDKIHHHFPRATRWKQAEDAAALCRTELREQGKTLPQKLSEQLVEVVGATDLGYLSYEMFKLSMLLDALGETSVQPKHVSSTIAVMEESSVFPVLDALGRANLRRLIPALGRVEKTTTGDPTIKVVRIMAPTLGKWASAVALDEKQVPFKEAASMMGHNQWFHRNKVLPPAKRWGSRKLVDLLGQLAEAERLVFQGSISPWIGLESRLVRACQSLRGRL
jgi:DNA polymerase III delta subunit